MLSRLLRDWWPWRTSAGADVEVFAGRVLFTGAAGTLGRAVLPRIRTGAAAWRLVDSLPSMPTRHFPDRHVVSLGGNTDAGPLLRDVDAVIHFAAQSKPARAAVLQRANVDMVDWLLNGMATANVKHLVFASSMHVMGMYERHESVRPGDEPRPDSTYGESKLEAEELIEEAARAYGISALILRIGHVARSADLAEPGNWLCVQDLAALTHAGLTRAPRGVTVVHAVTPHRGDDMGQHALNEQLGMRWSKAPTYRAALKRLSQWYGADPVAIRYRGGVFASGRADTEHGVHEAVGSEAAPLATDHL